MMINKQLRKRIKIIKKVAKKQKKKLKRKNMNQIVLHLPHLLHPQVRLVVIRIHLLVQDLEIKRIKIKKNKKNKNQLKLLLHKINLNRKLYSKNLVILILTIHLVIQILLKLLFGRRSKKNKMKQKTLKKIRKQLNKKQKLLKKKEYREKEKKSSLKKKIKE